MTVNVLTGMVYLVSSPFPELVPSIICMLSSGCHQTIGMLTVVRCGLLCVVAAIFKFATIS